MMSPTSIYHLVPVSQLKTGIEDAVYTPQRFSLDGFVHCAETPITTVAVANDYFASLDEPLAVLEINPLRLSAPLKFEAPAPLSGGTAHLRTASLFPHVYGPIDLVAIQAAAVLLQVDSQYVWPSDFCDLKAFLQQD
ncbi:MAG: DUF952 domain-containing protein [Thermosynechococcaceae cyanobacterium]